MSTWMAAAKGSAVYLGVELIEHPGANRSKPTERKMMSATYGAQPTSERGQQ
jgi:hypothetical protein